MSMTEESVKQEKERKGERHFEAAHCMRQFLGVMEFSIEQIATSFVYIVTPLPNTACSFSNAEMQKLFEKWEFSTCLIGDFIE